MTHTSKQLWLLVALAMALGLGRITPARAQAGKIVTTHSQIPIDVFVIGPNDKTIHFTGSFEMLARVTWGDPDERPHVEGLFNAGGVQGESEVGGIIVDWKPTGLYRFFQDGHVFPVEATFPLFRTGPGGRLQRVGSLGVSFEVTVGGDGGATGSAVGFILHD